MEYNYLKAVEADVREYIIDNINLKEYEKDEIEQKLYDDLFLEDSVTGNASGSYTFSTWQAEENLCHNMDILEEACSEYGQDVSEAIARGAEFCDVTIRCYYLSEAIGNVLDEYDEDAFLY